MIFGKTYARRIHTISFVNAARGLGWAFRSQPNFRVHSVIFLLVLLAAGYFKVRPEELLAIILVSALVFTAELFNTSLEALSDEVARSQTRELIRVCKDVAAGAVAVSSLAAVTVGLIIFIPYL